MIWIRSQDKETIKEIKEISITELECISIDGDGYLTLGIYSTKEKALKVLDMMQKVIVDNKYMEAGMPKIFTEQHCVFEMPQDDEVEA